MLEKTFWGPFFWKTPEKKLKTFFLRTFLPVSLASSIPVLGLERICPRKGCPSPQIFYVLRRALCPRLHFCFLCKSDCLLLLCTVSHVVCQEFCPNRTQHALNGRRCRKSCRNDIDCKGARKRCLCDNICGFSCFNPGKLIIYLYSYFFIFTNFYDDSALTSDQCFTLTSSSSTNKANWQRYALFITDMLYNILCKYPNDFIPRECQRSVQFKLKPGKT